MLVLAIDTASSYCSVALMENTVVLAQAEENIGKGHAEFLPQQLRQIMQKAKKSFRQIDYIGVNVGPGSFTGVRIGVAAARALSLALAKPVIGISAFAALKAEAAADYAEQNTEKPDFCVALTAPQGQIYSQYFPANNKIFAPKADTKEKLAAFLSEQLQQKRNLCLTGSAAADLAILLPSSKTEHIYILHKAPTAHINVFAALTGQNTMQTAKVVPLYMRAPDAKPQTTPLLARDRQQFRIQTATKNTTDKIAKKQAKKRRKDV